MNSPQFYGLNKNQVYEKIIYQPTHLLKGKSLLLKYTSTFFVFTIITYLFLLIFINPFSDPIPPDIQESKATISSVPETKPETHVTRQLLSQGGTLLSGLIDSGVDASEAHQIILATKNEINAKSLSPETAIEIFWQENKIEKIKIYTSKLLHLDLVKNDSGNWQSQWMEEKIEIQAKTFSGVVVNSLWESAEIAGLGPQAIIELTEIFSWQIDFAREVREGDRWRLLVEDHYLNGEFLGHGRILSAEYLNGPNLHQAILYRSQDATESYYGTDGQSLQKIFLKAPLKFSRISSRFTNKRFHPILKFNRPHLGVDYAASIGTPVRTVGDGVVTKAGYNQASGKFIEIRHNSVYRSSYQHLHGFEKKIKTGVKVAQGQLIGFVGKTGLATGPHLHFALFENGRYVDPLNIKFPSVKPVPQNELAHFKTHALQLVSLLPSWSKTYVKSISSLPDEKNFNQGF